MDGYRQMKDCKGTPTHGRFFDIDNCVSNEKAYINNCNSEYTKALADLKDPSTTDKERISQDKAALDRIVEVSGQPVPWWRPIGAAPELAPGKGGAGSTLASGCVPGACSGTPTLGVNTKDIDNAHTEAQTRIASAGVEMGTSKPGVPGEGTGKPGVPGVGTSNPAGTNLPDASKVIFNDGSKDGVKLVDLQKLITAGQAPAAENTLNQIVQNNSKNPLALQIRALSRLNQGNTAGALADVKATLAIAPNNKIAQQMQAFLENSGRAKDKELKLHAPDFGAMMLASAPGAGSAARLSGGKLNPSKAFNDATYGKLWGRLPSAQNLTPSEALVQEALRWGHIGDLKGARQAATRAIEADKTNPKAWGLRAALSNRMRDYTAAESDATEALKLNPRLVPALLERAFARYNLGNYSAALEDIGRAIKIEPMNALAYLYRGMVLEKLSRFAEALSDYEKAGQLDPTLKYFWDEAKTRILGIKPGGKGSVAKQVGLRAGVAGGVMLLALAAYYWRRKRKAQLARAEGPVKLA